MMTSTSYKIAFFGSDEFSVIALDRLKDSGFLPSVIISAPDKRQGRGLALSTSPVKDWALKNNVEILQPEKLLDPKFVQELSKNTYDLFVVVYYNKIIPKIILDMPQHGSINIHPSLLPKYRGPSPVKSQILNGDKEVGVSIMLIDEKMDHGPILAQEKIPPELMPMAEPELMKMLSSIGSDLLVKVLPDWVSGIITPMEQNHPEATFCQMIKKEDGLIDLNDNPQKNYLKYLAFKKWPGVFYFIERRGALVRIKITEAEYENEQFLIKKIIPEGKKEMNYPDFARNL